MLLIATLLVMALVFGVRFLPPEWDPRAPLDLRQDYGIFTAIKLARLRAAPQACFAAFAVSDIPLRRVADRRSDSGCEVENAAVLPAGVRMTPASPVVTCRAAAAWILFERHVLQPLAQQHLGSPVTTVRHLGTYNCRNVNRAQVGRRSEHATANAIDIGAFGLLDGREIVVARDWRRDDNAGEFLRGLRDGACRYFSVVLGPEYNIAHADHFHFDMGRGRICR